MNFPVIFVVLECAGPVVEVLGPIEVDICTGAASDLNPGGRLRAKAKEVMGIALARRISASGRALQMEVRVGNARAILEVANLVRESDVIAVRRPSHTSVLTRSGIHGMEGVRQTRA